MFLISQTLLGIFLLLQQFGILQRSESYIQSSSAAVLCKHERKWPQCTDVILGPLQMYHFLPAVEGFIAVDHVVLIIRRHLIHVLFCTNMLSVPLMYTVSGCKYIFVCFNSQVPYWWGLAQTTLLSLLFNPTNMVLQTLSKKQKDFALTTGLLTAWLLKGTTTSPVFFVAHHMRGVSELGCWLGTIWLWKTGWRNKPRVPTTHTIIKIHRNIRSTTIATYFQSSITCKYTEIKSKLVSVHVFVTTNFTNQQYCRGLRGPK